MLVFDPRSVENIFEALLGQSIPSITRSTLSEKLVYANSVFLMARYAHYVHGGDLLEQVLVRGVLAIPLQIKKGSMPSTALE